MGDSAAGAGDSAADLFLGVLRGLRGLAGGGGLMDLFLGGTISDMSGAS